MPNTKILEVLEKVQKIVDCMRCMICDKLGGAQYRLPCGHAGCDQCLKESIECLLCLTPPNKPSVLDITLTQQVRNVETLLKVCQDTFDIEVLKNKRASEKLRIEKEIFPECIQASVKYFNKRKSTNNFKDKENIIPTNFPGESISPIKDSRMENSKTNVELWFQMNEKGVRKIPHRKPFADLVANNQNILSCSNISNPLTSRAKLIFNKVNSIEKGKEDPKPVSSRKRSHIKTLSERIESRINLDKYITPCSVKKSKKEIKIKKKNTGVCKIYNNESGIEVDDDPIVIEDTQSPIIDKDREAWLAVLEAEKNQDHTSESIIRSDNSDVMESSNAKRIVETKQSTSKVPFYKKSQLMDDFGMDHTSNASSKANGDKSNVSITVENDSFVISITVSQANQGNVESKTCDKSSVSVQTDIEHVKDESVLDVALIKKIHHSNLEDSGIESNNASKIVRRQRHDLFITKNKMENKNIKETEEFCEKLPSSGHVIIEDSDSDIDLTNCSSLIEVTAEVHRASDETDVRVLRQMSPNDNRRRRGPRGPSPGTSDSSDKENYDPNKMKRPRLHKKFAKKK